MESSMDGVQEPEKFRKLFIGGLSLTTNDQTLRDFYSKFGTITDCVVMKDRHTGKTRAFGFVTYSSRQEVDKAMAARPHAFDGKTVDPKRAIPRDKPGPSGVSISTPRLYIDGVREEHTDEHFLEYFSKFGTVIKVEIPLTKATGMRRGFAFITFEDYDSVDRAILTSPHTINGVVCNAKKGLSRDELTKVQTDRDRFMREGRMRGGGRGGSNVWQGGRGGGAPTGPFRELHNNYAPQSPWATGASQIYQSQWEYGVPSPHVYTQPQQQQWSANVDWNASQGGWASQGPVYTSPNYNSPPGQ